MRFQIGDTVRIAKNAGGQLDNCDEFWQEEKTEGEITEIGLDDEYPIKVEFDEEYECPEYEDIHEYSTFSEDQLRLVRR